MSFQFESLADFWFMSGHGPYVWAAYAITFVGLLGLVGQAKMRKKELIKKIKLAQLRLAQVNSDSLK